MQQITRNQLFEEKLPLVDRVMKRYSWEIQIYRLCREDVWQELALRMLECLDRYDAEICPNVDAYLVKQLRYALLHQTAPSKRYGIPNAPRGCVLQIISLEENCAETSYTEMPDDLFAVREEILALPHSQRCAIRRAVYDGRIRSSNKALRCARLHLHKKVKGYNGKRLKRQGA